MRAASKKNRCSVVDVLERVELVRRIFDQILEAFFHGLDEGVPAEQESTLLLDYFHYTLSFCVAHAAVYTEKSYVCRISASMACMREARGV